MKDLSFFNAISEVVKSTNNSESVKSEFIRDFSKFTELASENPQDTNSANTAVLKSLLLLILDVVEERYGESDAQIFPEPRFKEKGDSSQVAPLIGDPSTFGVALSTCVTTWEQAFYELCHESVHLLNPVADIETNPVSSMDEGVAVKFAEAMYARVISTYTGQKPSITPTRAETGNPYRRAFEIVKKIPDEQLRQVRKEFGAFSIVNDVPSLLKIVRAHISEEEAQTICLPFPYPKGR